MVDSRASICSEILHVQRLSLKPKPIPEKDPNRLLESKSKDNLLYYEIDDVPPWYLALILGFQHYLTMAGSTVSVPFILTPALCMAADDPEKANIISTLIFVSGIVTLLQCTFGTRLPIIQGASFSFLVPSLAVLSLPQWKCPETLEGLTDDEKTELWQIRIREIQGAIIISAAFELLFGLLGVVGLVLRFITPMTVAPTITLIGLSLFKTAATSAASNWAISILTVVLLAIFSQYFRNVKIPIPFTRAPEDESKFVRYPFFQVFPVLLTMATTWILCYILTATDVFPEGNQARTDMKTKIIDQAAWFRVPYPFQWGWPTVTAGAVLGMLSGVIAGTVESIGDYYACARICGTGPPPTHAINRGIFVEGLGCVLAGIWGTGNGTTSYALNIGAISVTKVGSRRVIQAAGVLMLICALIGKVGAVFISIPEPIIGGVFCVVFATVTAVGLSNLQNVDLNSPRNIFIIGVSIFFGLFISQWMEQNSHVIKTGAENLDQILTVLLSTGMFVAGFLGFFLDNTIPGTLEERGLIAWDEESSTEFNGDGELLPPRQHKAFDLPFGMNFIKRQKWLSAFPLSPTFTFTLNKKKLIGKGKSEESANNNNIP